MKKKTRLRKLLSPGSVRSCSSPLIGSAGLLPAQAVAVALAVGAALATAPGCIPYGETHVAEQELSGGWTMYGVQYPAPDKQAQLEPRPVSTDAVAACIRFLKPGLDKRDFSAAYPDDAAIARLAQEIAGKLGTFGEVRLKAPFAVGQGLLAVLATLKSKPGLLSCSYTYGNTIDNSLSSNGSTTFPDGTKKEVQPAGAAGTKPERDSGATEEAVDCRLNSDCPEGQLCRAAKCIVECREDRDCDSGKHCSSGRCE